MKYDDVAFLRERSPAWRLVRADNAVLVLSFLGSVFVTENVRAISAAELTDRLDDELYALRSLLGEQAYPQSAKAYLEEWAKPEVGWLRKYYPPGSDEAYFDATPALEKAVAWVDSLQARSFVGTESRLNTIVDLLRQMVFGTETDAQVRLAELHRRRSEIDREITEVESGHLPLLGDAALRDRYQQFTRTARELLADFREVESNLRALDRQTREQIATWHESKGELLDNVFGSRHTITESDQGRSFRAFYDFLLSRDRREELDQLLQRVHEVDAIADADQRMRHVHDDWLDAGERTQATVRLLSEQLRRFLDDQVWLENRRVMDLLRHIEATAIELRGHGEPPTTMEIDAPSPKIALPMERPLYAPNATASLDSRVTSSTEEVDVSSLLGQVYVDVERLAGMVRDELRTRPQVDLTDVLTRRPIEQGLAELVGYLSLVDDAFQVVFDDSSEVYVRWHDHEGIERVASLPRIVFARGPVATGGTT